MCHTLYDEDDGLVEWWWRTQSPAGRRHKCLQQPPEACKYSQSFPPTDRDHVHYLHVNEDLRTTHTRLFWYVCSFTINIFLFCRELEVYSQKGSDEEEHHLWEIPRPDWYRTEYTTQTPEYRQRTTTPRFQTQTSDTPGCWPGWRIHNLNTNTSFSQTFSHFNTRDSGVSLSFINSNRSFGFWENDASFALFLDEMPIQKGFWLFLVP